MNISMTEHHMTFWLCFKYFFFAFEDK